MNKLPVILSATVPHALQEYDTAGNYFETAGMWNITVSEMSDWRMSAAVLVHELVEMCLTKHDNIDWDVITHFDKHEGAELSDPGCSEDAPYHKQHMYAVEIEKMFCHMIGIDWGAYNAELDKLVY